MLDLGAESDLEYVATVVVVVVANCGFSSFG